MSIMALASKASSRKSVSIIAEDIAEGNLKQPTLRDHQGPQQPYAAVAAAATTSVENRRGSPKSGNSGDDHGRVDDNGNGQVVTTKSHGPTNDKYINGKIRTVGKLFFLPSFLSPAQQKN